MVENSVFDDVNKLSPIDTEKLKSLDEILEEEEMRPRSPSNTGLFSKLFKKRAVSFTVLQKRILVYIHLNA